MAISKQLAADAKAFDPSIDVLELDKEWLGQPKLHRLWLHHLADCKRDLRELENELKAYMAELANKIRRDPEVFKLTKSPTVDAIKDAVLSDTGTKQRQRDISDAQHLVDMVGANCDVCDTRRRGIQDLVELFRINYCADPRHGGDVPIAAATGKDTAAAREAVLRRAQEKLAGRTKERKA